MEILLNIIYFVLFGAYFALALKDLKIAVCILPFAFPLYLVKLNLGVPFTFIEILIYVVFLVFVVKRWRKLMEMEVKVMDFLKSIYFPIFLIFLFCTFAVFVMPDSMTLFSGEEYESRKVALGIWKGWIVNPILFFILFVNVVKDIKWRFLALDSYVFSAVVLSLMALYQQITGVFITEDMRASGPFESANYLALYVVPACIYIGILIYKRIILKVGKKEAEIGFFKNNWIYIVSFIAILCGVLLSQSYAGLIAVLGTFGVFGLMELFKLKSKKVTLIVLGSFAVLLIVVVLTQMGTEKFDQFLDFTQRNSTTVRLQVWKTSWELFKNNAVFGLGLGQFEPMYQLNIPWILKGVPYEWVMLHPHNIFLAFLLNCGLLGLGAFLFIVGRFLQSVLKGLKKEQFRLIAMIALFMMISIFIHGLFDTPFWKNDLSLLFFLILGSSYR